MRRITTLSALSALAATLAVAGCRSDARTGNEAMTADLERDLALASSKGVELAKTNDPRTHVVSAVEQVAFGAPSGTDRGRRAAVRVPKKAPVASPSKEVQEVAAADIAAEDPAPLATATVPEPVPTPAPTPAPVAPDPVPGPIITTAPTSGSGPSTGTGDGDYGRGRRGGSGNGGGIGTIIGVIIRGGGAGDDHCEPQGGRRGGGIGTILGGMGGMGGMGGIPVRRPTFPR